MSVRPVKLESSGSSFAISARLSLITVPTLNRFSSSSGVSSITARSQNERTTEVSEVSTQHGKAQRQRALAGGIQQKQRRQPTIATPDNPCRRTAR